MTDEIKTTDDLLKRFEKGKEIDFDYEKLIKDSIDPDKVVETMKDISEDYIKETSHKNGKEYNTDTKEDIHMMYNERISNLKDVMDIQLQDGNYNYDDYNLGMANGLILAMSIMRGEEPQYIEGKDVKFKQRYDFNVPQLVYDAFCEGYNMCYESENPTLVDWSKSNSKKVIDEGKWD